MLTPKPEINIRKEWYFSQSARHRQGHPSGHNPIGDKLVTTSGSSGASTPLGVGSGEICEINVGGHRFLYNAGIGSEVPSMESLKLLDHSQLRALIASYEAQAAEALRIAGDLKRVLEGSPTTRQGLQPVPRPTADSLIANLQPNSTLATAVKILAESDKPMHITSLVAEVSKRKGVETPRASLESTLGTAIKDRKHGLMRPAPGMYAVRL